ncbi:MAG: 4Fe-4S ferredoxin [Candidatus Helarchaeota archaeon]|nr:4Fe-4S ferredoxin [Candidatus Helarchaeota archaeon]
MFNLLETNLGDNELREKRRILLTGTCLIRRYPDILKDFLKKFNSPAQQHICLETHHMDQVGYKLTLMIRYSSIEELTILTIDGSPHCLQLHYLAEDQCKFYPDLKINHFVIEKGTVHEIESKAVKISRHLHKVQKLIKQ